MQLLIHWGLMNPAHVHGEGIPRHRSAVSVPPNQRLGPPRGTSVGKSLGPAARGLKPFGQSHPPTGIVYTRQGTYGRFHPRRSSTASTTSRRIQSFQVERTKQTFAEQTRFRNSASFSRLLCAWHSYRPIPAQDRQPVRCQAGLTRSWGRAKMIFCLSPQPRKTNVGADDGIVVEICGHACRHRRNMTIRITRGRIRTHQRIR